MHTEGTMTAKDYPVVWSDQIPVSRRHGSIEIFEAILDEDRVLISYERTTARGRHMDGQNVNLTFKQFDAMVKAVNAAWAKKKSS